MTSTRTEKRGLHHGTVAVRTRRTVGPAAWAVLEVLAEQAERDGDRTVSRCSVRGVAAELGLANDTVARALRRLAGSGLLRHEADRGASGRFGSGCYVLTLPADLFELDSELEHTSAPDTITKRPTRRTSGEQLALLAEG